MVNAENISCYSCGASVSIDAKTCEYCQNPVRITTFNSIKDMQPPLVNKYISKYMKEAPDDRDSAKALSLCFLKLKLYDKAEKAFDQTIDSNYDDSESFFYAAVCALKGKKAFLAPRNAINKALEYINAAIMIEPRSIYHYFLAYIKYDFFNRKGFKIDPDFHEEFNTAKSLGLAGGDVEYFYQALGVARPDAI